MIFEEKSLNYSNCITTRNMFKKIFFYGKFFCLCFLFWSLLSYAQDPSLLIVGLIVSIALSLTFYYFDFFHRFGFERCVNPICPFDKKNSNFLSIRNDTLQQYIVGYEPEFKAGKK